MRKLTVDLESFRVKFKLVIKAYDGGYSTLFMLSPGILCVASFLVGLLFCQRSGEYWLQMFDSFSGTIPVLFIGFFELIAVHYIYGASK